MRKPCFVKVLLGSMAVKSKKLVRRCSPEDNLDGHQLVVSFHISFRTVGELICVLDEGEADIDINEAMLFLLALFKHPKIPIGLF